MLTTFLSSAFFPTTSVKELPVIKKFTFPFPFSIRKYRWKVLSMPNFNQYPMQPERPGYDSSRWLFCYCCCCCFNLMSQEDNKMAMEFCANGTVISASGKKWSHLRRSSVCSGTFMCDWHVASAFQPSYRKI